MFNKKQLGENINKYREAVGLTREELAEKIGVSYSTIAMYERGEREPNIKTLIELAAYLRTSLNILLNISKEIYNPKEFETLKEFNQLTKDNQDIVLKIIKALK